MKKYILDLDVVDSVHLREGYVLLKLTDSSPLPPMLPGQFAELKVEGSETTFLRRPISINYVDEEKNEVWFLIHEVGDGTRKLGELSKGGKLNVVMPLGNGFTMPETPEITLINRQRTIHTARSPCRKQSDCSVKASLHIHCLTPHHRKRLLTGISRHPDTPLSVLCSQHWYR